MTQEQIEELKRLESAATPGPWVAGGPSFGAPFPVWCDEVVTESGGDNPDSICMAPSGGEETSTENMAFIAAARNAVPELIAEVERITKQRDELLAKIAEWERCAANWMASPEAAQRLSGYRELAQRLNTAEQQRDELLAALKGMVYKSEGRYCSGFYGDTDVTDEVGAVIEKCEAQS